MGSSSRTVHNDYVTYTIPWNMLKTSLLHFWSPEWVVPSPKTVKYMIGFNECWLDSSNSQYTDMLCFNLGIDMVTPAGEPYTGARKHHAEFMTSRFKELTTNRRFVYGHNIRYYETDSVFANYEELKGMIDEKQIKVWN